MRIQLVSDLHTEFFSGETAVRLLAKSLLSDADLLVLAGDTGLLSQRPEQIQAYRNLLAFLDVVYAHYPHVVYIPGNHEYYFSSFREVEKQAAVLHGLFPHLIWGDRTSIPIGQNTRAHFCTLWFGHQKNSQLFWPQMTDARWIGDQEIPRKVPNLRADGIPSSTHFHVEGFAPLSFFEQMGARDISWLNSVVKPGDWIFTHHLPHIRSVPEEFKTSKCNPFFVNQDASQILEKGPTLWAHGHTHQACNYSLEESSLCGLQIICNPRGYEGREIYSNEHFNPQLVLEKWL